MKQENKYKPFITYLLSIRKSFGLKMTDLFIMHDTNIISSVLKNNDTYKNTQKRKSQQTTQAKQVKFKETKETNIKETNIKETHIKTKEIDSTILDFDSHLDKTIKKYLVDYKEEYRKNNRNTFVSYTILNEMYHVIYLNIDGLLEFKNIDKTLYIKWIKFLITTLDKCNEALSIIYYDLKNFEMTENDMIYHSNQTSPKEAQNSPVSIYSSDVRIKKLYHRSMIMLYDTLVIVKKRLNKELVKCNVDLKLLDR